ncbi:Kinesin, motor domain-containing protein [Cynara cardunculus var. scolymus]|uniref:Kinesin-like protein n=1 Tax=Cynara cardunculus var. scolymus TaxID=59895 RepID=A0A103XZB0_CYNCS|nr:Kinesin, motor domain-containing protein [Cynara cardunculus var. scolymus]
MEKICVAVRVRPPVKSEDDSTTNGSHWKVEENRISLHRSLAGTPLPPALSYTFGTLSFVLLLLYFIVNWDDLMYLCLYVDHVFDQDCSNSSVYDLLTKDIIHAVVDGFNGTAFAYGQTSSGKTFTMNGSENDPGIIHRAIKDIFAKTTMSTDREFLIRVSYMEIYNEEINDLFAVENQKLQIHESLEHGVFVAGLREEIVNSAEQVLKLLDMGEVNRHFGETNMNVRSSRSHTIFRMVIESKGKDASSNDDSTLDDAIRVSVLNLVDLAGSERIAKTGAGGVRLKEGKHINKSLMILGNVINKLSDGARQRGHIPYRDSKLTRILQPALGGNAKTSIICTVAPEEVHIEETKGTLQFASRAKRITNCVQVNEILTDAALLKRQKIEIEELRKKLEGSHAGVLEQEILKLRNDMLKYELEREKLAMELEEERKSNRQQDQCSREQSNRTGSANTSFTLSDSDRVSAQVIIACSVHGAAAIASSWLHPLLTEIQPHQYHPPVIAGRLPSPLSDVAGSESLRQYLKEETSDTCSTQQGDAFSTPTFKPIPNAFVAKRSYHSRTPQFSPLPDEFGDVADEDMWFKMNNGFVADLDSIGTTPAREVSSIPAIDEIPDSSIDNYREVQNLRRQLQQAIDEKNGFEKQHKEQLALNNQLMEEISKLKNEARLVQEIPQELSESLANCKAVSEDIFSTFQSFVADEKSPTAKLLSSTSEIVTFLMSTFETHVSMAMDGFRSTSHKKSPNSIEEDDMGSLQHCNKYKECTLGQRIASWKAEVRGEIELMKERYESLEQELDTNNHILEACKERIHGLERERQLLSEERDDLLTDSSTRVALLTQQNEKILQDMRSEIRKRKDLEEEIKQFSIAFASRQRSLVLFHNDFKSKLDNLKAQSPLMLPKSCG